MKKKRNYSRLYAIAKAKGIDLDQHKETLVSQFTDGRTSSLREMAPAEYEEMCECLQTGKQLGETSAAYKERLRRARSAALNRMQRLGVDTADRTFSAVNDFCLDPRIAGKPFGVLTIEELQALVPKLEAILRKPKPVKVERVIPISFIVRPDQLPS
ncbi:hypothetical protein K320107C7_09800 [Alistipes shahii]|uniref:hypothetical protein n=1 Tax=Alistipes shahii TaxID=328814 RepID=UPI0036F2FF38